jgi:L-ascorbate metabolism protein UlaG (beta-lactamase superfamily)
MHKGLRIGLLALGAMSLVAFAVFGAIRGGSIVPGDFTADGKAFDFNNPQCQAAVTTPATDAVDVRYLGSGGIYLGWKGNAILLGPFFSNPSVTAAQFGHLHHDLDRIQQHMQAIAGVPIRAILTGHSHYDHIGDVPIVARQYAPQAKIYANSTGTRMLAAYSYLRGRLATIDEHTPIHITDAAGKEIVRIQAVISDHAPQLCSCRHWPCDFADCKVEQDWTTPFEQHKLREFCGGQTYAFVIDLLDGDKIQYRIYYNDAAATAPLGIPSAAISAKHPFDLAILCMASYDFVKQYPSMLLVALKPRHVVLSHYEDFFSRSEGRWRFVPLLTDAKAARFLRELRDSHVVINPLPPTNKVCGPSTSEWTMPVPAEQMLFRPGGR